FLVSSSRGPAASREPAARRKKRRVCMGRLRRLGLESYRERFYIFGMAVSVLGLDIGGANLKAAQVDGTAWLQPFALWKNPHALAHALRQLLDRFRSRDLLAVTMTGELCDCFETKRQGVHAILDAVTEAAHGVPVRVWRTDGRFVGPAEARATPLL